MTQKVLIVDDEPNIVMSLEFLLGQRGYQTRVARDGAEALTLVDEYEPDLILLDVMLPKVNGYEVARQLRDAGRTDLPIIMLSARGRETEIARGLAVGASRYVTKPFSTRDLVDQVAALLEDSG